MKLKMSFVLKIKPLFSTLNIILKQHHFLSSQK